MATTLTELKAAVNAKLTTALTGLSGLDTVNVIASEPTHIYAPMLYTIWKRTAYKRTAGYKGRVIYLSSRLVLLWQVNDVADEQLQEYVEAIEDAFDSTTLSGEIVGRIALESVEPGFLPVNNVKYRMVEVVTSTIAPKSTSSC